MKMNKFCLGACMALLVLSGCSGKNTSTIADENTSLFTVGDVTYDKGDLYTLIKESDGPDLLITLALTKIYDAEVPRTDEIKEEAKKDYDELAKQTENIETQLKEAGYTDSQQYIDMVLIPNIQSKKLTELYFEKNEDSIVENYKPSVAKIIQCDSKENAEKALSALKEGKSMEDTVKEFASETASFKGEEQVITTNNTTLPTRLVNSLSSAKNAGVVDEVFANDDESSFYVADLVSDNYKDNISKYVDALSSDSELAQQVLIYYLSEYKFEVHDQYLFNQFKINTPQYLVTRPDLMESKTLN